MGTTAAPNRTPFTQADAARAAFGGGPLTRTRITFAALRALLRNPEDTSQVFLIGLTTNARRFPMFIARLAADENGARLLREQPSIDSKHVDYDALRALPADTLGGAYVRFLDENGLDPDLFQPPPGLPSMIAYIAQRLRQSHDLWHVVTGYGSDVEGELALQAFTHQVTGLPSSALISIGGALRFGLVGRRRGIFRALREGRRRGKRAAFLPAVVWEDHFERPLTDVRRELGIAA